MRKILRVLVSLCGRGAGQLDRAVPLRRSVPCIRALLTTLVLIASVLILLSSPAPAEAVVCVNNDDFVCADVIGAPPDSQTGNNTGFTLEAGELTPTCNNMSFKTAWWNWSAPKNGDFRIDTFGSAFDTVLAVYTGDAVDALTEVACNDDFGGLQSWLTFHATAGTTYRIGVDASYSIPSGSIVLNVSDDLGCVNNDVFVCADVIGAPPDSQTGNSRGFTIEAGEPSPTCNYSSMTAWWNWTAPGSGDVRIDTFGSAFDTVLSVYTGDAVDALTEVACNDDFGGLQSWLTFEATAGTTYRIRVDDRYSGSGGSIVLNISDYLGCVNNNDFVCADVIGGPPDTQTSNNTGFTVEAGELTPSCGGPSSTSTAWWNWTAPSNGDFRIDTFGSSFDTVLAVYTGDDVNDLVGVACNDDFGGYQSWLTFEATAGATYRIQVDSYILLSTGAIVLNTSDHIGCVTNDDFACADVLGGPPDTQTGNNRGFTVEPGEPAQSCNDYPSPGLRTAWWEWAASRTEQVTIDTLSSEGSQVIAVYTGDAVDGLTEVACNSDALQCIPDDCWSATSVTFEATAGTTYRIQVDAHDPASVGRIDSLNISVEVPPTTVGIAPASATVVADTATTFKATYRDANSWLSLRYDELLVSAGGGAPECRIRYQQDRGVFQVHDGGWIDVDRWGSPVSTVFCTLDPARSYVEWDARSDGHVYFNLAFSSAFTGRHGLFLRAEDDKGNTSSLDERGYVIVQEPVAGPPPIFIPPPPTPRLRVDLTITNDDGGAAQAEDFTILVDNTIELTAGNPVLLGFGGHMVSVDGPTAFYAVEFGGSCFEDGTVTLLGGLSICTVDLDDQPISLVLAGPPPGSVALIDESLSLTADAFGSDGTMYVAASSTGTPPEITVAVPIDAIPGVETITILVSRANEPAIDLNPPPGSLLIGGTAYVIQIVDGAGDPITDFALPIELSFLVPAGTGPVDAYYFDAELALWVFQSGSLSGSRFDIASSHLTTFALFEVAPGGGLLGQPPSRGVWLATAEGGSVIQLDLALVQAGASGAFIAQQGQWVSYLPSAPDFVNEEFRDLFAAGVPQGEVLLIVMRG